MIVRFRLAAIAAAALVLAACSGTATTVPGLMHATTGQSIAHGYVDNVPAGVHVMRPVGYAFHAASPDIQLNYQGGPTLHTAHVFVVFWGFNVTGSDPSGEQAYLTAFLNGVGGSSWNNINHQYYQIVAGKKQFILNATGQLKGTWVDTKAVPSSPTDAQIQAEAKRLVTHFGFNKNASYVVATPHGHNSPGFGSSYCAYHGAFLHGTGPASVSYTNLPYMTDAGANCGEGFINSPGLLDGVSIVEGHEYAESQTDPVPPSGWYNSSYGEIGDICAWQRPPAADITLSTGTFAVQGLFSNASSSCVISYP